MKYFHPVTMFIFFAAMIVSLMLINNPVYSVILLAGAVLIFLSLKGVSGISKELLGYLSIFIVMAVLNPLFVHRGSTPLFFLNGKAITKEAVMYGINSSFQLVAAIMWCRNFSIVMTTEKLFCLLGKLSPKITAMLTLAVRFIPDLLSQAKKIKSYSLISGRYEEKTLLGNIKRYTGIFSALITWAIESGVQTADSMKARGFELGGRTSYSSFRFSAEDFILTFMSIICCVLPFFASEKVNILFYPTLNYAVDTMYLIAITVVVTLTFMFPAAFTIFINYRRKNNYVQKVSGK